MNTKDIHQNLLRQAVTLAVVMITMFAPIAGAWAQQVLPELYALWLVEGWDANGATVSASYLMGDETQVYTSEQFGEEPATPVPEGTTVTLTIMPGEGYVVDEVSVAKYEEQPEEGFVIGGGSRTRGTADASVVVSHTDDTNVWSFTMPAYNAEATVTYKAKPVQKKAIEASWITLTDATNLVYDGTDKKPGVTVTDGETTLSAETDYEVTYSNNKNACESTAENAPTVTVSVKDGDDTYAGSASVTFAIARKPVTVTGGITAKSVTENGNTTAVIDCSEATITGAVGTDVLTIDGVTGSIDAGDANMVTLNYTRASLTIGDAEATNYVISAGGNQAKATISSVIEEKRNEDGTKTITTVEKKVEEDESVTEIIVELMENENGEVIGKKESEKNTKENADHSTVIKETTVVKDGDNNVIKTIEKEITIDPNGNKRETTVEKDANGTTSTTCTDTNNMALSDEAPKIQVAGVDDLRQLKDNGTGVLQKVTDVALAVSQKDADKIKTVQSVQVVQEFDRPAEPERRTEHLRITEITEPFNVYFERSQRHSTLQINYAGGVINLLSRMVQKIIDDAMNRHAHARSTQADDEEIIIESGVQYEILTDEPFAITFMANEGDIEIESIKIENPIDIDGNGVVNAVDLVKAIAVGKTQDGIDEIVNAIMQK